MKKLSNQFLYPTALALAAVLLAFMVLASPSPARAASGDQGPSTSVATPPSDRVEARIKELHTKLNITPAQEEQWNKVAQAMRDNAKAMEPLIKARLEKASTMTAIDDLKSYSEIADAHADGLKKFIPAFEPLYAGMSDAQKKSADMLFRQHARMKAKGKGK